ncbi:MAG: hypothetical protein ORO03_02175, partial [Alphaproteobacteria bacterium]|nr:hypothetical protein [Alphaproteobacteria bacterium]
VYYTSATSGNAANIAVGGGSFTFVNNKRSTTTATTLTDSSTSSVWGTGLGTMSLTTVGTIKSASGGGLTIETNAAATASAVNQQGVVFGGLVTVDGVTTGGARDLRWIEGTAVGVLNNASTFAGKLVLASSGGAITAPDSSSAAILIGANLSSASTTDANQSLTLLQYGTAGGHGTFLNSTVNFGGNVMLVQTGSVTGSGIYLSSGNNTSPIVSSGAGSIGLYQGAVAGGSGIWLNGALLTTLAANANLVLRQSAAAGSHGISVSATLRTKGSLTLSQSGSVVGNAITISTSTLDAHSGSPTNPTGTMTIITSATTVADDHGIQLQDTQVTVAQDLSLTQLGSA